MNYVVVDSGGTSTKCFYYQKSGQLLAQFITDPFFHKPGYVYHNGNIMKEIEVVIVEKNSMELGNTHWIFSLAGLYKKNDFLPFEGQMNEIMKVPHYQLMSDILFAYYQNIPSSFANGLLILSGNGSICFWTNVHINFIAAMVGGLYWAIPVRAIMWVLGFKSFGSYS